MRNLLLMVQFMTRYPIPLHIDFTVERFVHGMKWMPVVGLLIGVPSALLAMGLYSLVGYEAAVLAGLIYQICITGGLHLDGLADSADGLFSYRPRERVLEIMRDSTLGTNGVIALCLAVLSKYVLLQSLSPHGGFLALASMPILGRMASTWHAACAEYARKSDGMGLFVNKTRPRQAMAAFLSSFFILCVVFFVSGISLQMALLLLFGLNALCISGGFFLARYVTGRIGGITGDTIGATIELTEIASLFLYLFIWNIYL
ncbi:adenosylcobinamide-GDP ribazoletransferase [Desulfogranum japonicum]|uniref:adenosylcobinamide-GDP ribazoletransferase n=1 Tax=Desulfogranum japonicum TaxID=231447 RepID=UPI0003FAF592|nr:adenosylcobinamide-GDP ribazoletransferase [Desulfogranum japonicum]